MTSTDEIFTPRALSANTFELTIPTGWEQGRATFGGLVVASTVRAMQHALTAHPQRHLRTLSAELVGSPQPGTATIATRLVRQSKTVSTLQAELSQGGEVHTHVVGVFGDARQFTETWRHLPTRATKPWREIEPLDMDTPFAPNFAKHFEYRALQGYPFSGQHPPIASGWIRPRDRGQQRDAAYIAALADAWWLAAMVSLTEPRPAATLSFSLDVHDRMLGLDPDAPLLHYAETVALSEGYATEVRELWGDDGRLVAINRQVTTIIK